MAKSIFKNIEIKGISLVTGENDVYFKDCPQYWQNDSEQMKKLAKTIGFDRRYEANPETTTCDLCCEASNNILAALNINSTDIDGIISVTQTPDYKTPGNAHILHSRLKLNKDAIALDITSGCSGYVYGLFIAYSLINSGLNRILLVAGDTLSKIVNQKDKSEAPLIGDAGSATIIEKSDLDNKAYFILRSDGNGHKAIYQPAGGCRVPCSAETAQEYTDKDGNIRCKNNCYINGFEVFKFTLTEQPPLLNDIIEFSNKSKNEIDYFFFHQANKYIVDTLVKNAKIAPEKAPIPFSLYGNMNSASIPVTICNEFKNNTTGIINVVLQGFGAGLSWGALQTQFNNVICLEPVQYKGENNE